MREHSHHFWLRMLGNVAVFAVLIGALFLLLSIMRQGIEAGGVF